MKHIGHEPISFSFQISSSSNTILKRYGKDFILTLVLEDVIFGFLVNIQDLYKLWMFVIQSFIFFMECL